MYIAIFIDSMFFSLRRDTVKKKYVIFTMRIQKSGKYEILGFYNNSIKNHIAYKNMLMDF